MLKLLRSLLSRSEQANLPAVPAGQRIYAVGDVHGRRDLFEAMVAAIEEDDAQATPARSTVILLGDLVDRGPDSAGVLARARRWQQEREVRILCGNHEEMFLKSFDSTDMLRHFMRHGGRQTVASYGVSMRAISAAEVEEIQAMMHQAVPQADREFMAGFEDMIVLGDYVFVHAGIDPQVPIHEQRAADLRWIREPFLSHSEPYDQVVVHGHTISEEPELRGNRIGIDTGAYASNRLTGLVLEGSTRRLIEVRSDEDGQVSVAKRAA
ncbi:metallophosphoesterase family protein [Alteraurantiacibacter buctensis]|uniref:Serine/threonine protein phosphatase n=1 Tax=Alteraurantiacibacter buctensis TaxID=1503981 RepID=A0A844Z2B2_9SPHN|nr:metallophosphoesterase family protein [Alteraurantiacibacter buctensis]MXO73290.1 serine/threonine protein phosphatase [Alteraurantiacibacter buctensis]